MKSIRSISWLFGIVALTCSVPANALEKTSVRAPKSHERLDEQWFSRSGSCEVSYYNTCQGWAWAWGGTFNASDRIGSVIDPRCFGWVLGEVNHTLIHVWTGSPSGYGFTGTVEVSGVDANQCPSGAPLASTPFLPIAGWNTVSFSPPVSVSGSFAIVATLGAGVGNPVEFTSDHPAAVGAGAPSCGSCYPLSRVSRSYEWGSTSSPACPGNRLDDGTCNAELLITVRLSNVVPVESSTWSHIKSLYR